jgi:hypothetical protein
LLPSEHAPFSKCDIFQSPVSGFRLEPGCPRRLSAHQKTVLGRRPLNFPDPRYADPQFRSQRFWLDLLELMRRRRVLQTGFAPMCKPKFSAANNKRIEHHPGAMARGISKR